MDLPRQQIGFFGEGEGWAGRGGEGVVSLVLRAQEIRKEEMREERRVHIRGEHGREMGKEKRREERECVTHTPSVLSRRD